jgi:glutathione peroxidase
MQRLWQVLIGLLLCAQIACAAAPEAAKHKSIYDYSLVGLDGKVVSLSTYKGKVLLIVNLASKSIYSDQIAALAELQKTYSDKGLVILGIPSSDFGAEEAADNSAIEKYYHDTAHANFTVFSKACVRGNDAIPLVHFLTDPKEGTPGGDIHWNFTKFVVNREGQAILRFESDSDPSDPEFRVKLEQVLDGTFKKKGATPKDGAPPAGDDDEDDGG